MSHRGMKIIWGSLNIWFFIDSEAQITDFRVYRQQSEDKNAFLSVKTGCILELRDEEREAYSLLQHQWIAAGSNCESKLVDISHCLEVETDFFLTRAARCASFLIFLEISYLLGSQGSWEIALSLQASAWGMQHFRKCFKKSFCWVGTYICYRDIQ